MQRLKPPDAWSTAREREERRRGLTNVASVVLHVVAAFVLVKSLELPAAFRELLHLSNRIPFVEEKLNYVGVGARGAPAARPAAAPQTSSPQVAAPPLVAPRETPTAIPPAPTAPVAPPAVIGGPVTGPLVGGQGALRGAQPTYSDPRVWIENPVLVTSPKTDDERLDSAVVSAIKHFQDSLVANAIVPNKFERGDWTFEKGGRRYGIDPQFIRLGKFSIPTALLGLLPFNVQSNPMVADRQRQQLAMRTDIMEHAQWSLNEEEFRRAVKAIRERKERERKNLLAGTVVAVKKKDTRAIVAPSERPPD